MNRDEVRVLLDLMSTYDAREVTDVAVHAWKVQADRGRWDFQVAVHAVSAFYEWAEEDPITWSCGHGPRPILPADINAFHEIDAVTS